MNSTDRPREQAEHEPLLLQEEKTGSYGTVVNAEEKTSGDSEVLQYGDLSNAPTPLPVKQLVVIFLMRLAEPIAYSQYINEMMEEIGAVDDPRQAGYYSGVTESVFAVAELLTVMKWGSLSDRVGRKPVLLIGFAGAMLSTLLFGVSKSFIWALTTRFLAGCLSGNIAVLMSAVADMTDKTNHARAFSVFGIAGNFAHMAGPSIGGAFANPAITFPESFGSLLLFQKFPFLLPCVICAIITLAAAFCGAVFFEETLRRHPSETKYAVQAHIQPEQSSAWRIATSPLMFSVIKPFFLLSVLNTSFNVVFSLFAYTPVLLGGLSRNPEEIGLAIASAGLIGAIIQVIILPELQRQYGTIPLYRFFVSLYPLLFLLFPVINALARCTFRDIEDEGYSSQPASLPVWCLVGILLALNRLSSMAFSLNLILTKNASPSVAVQGKVFALSQFVNCVARAVAPAFVSSLFAFSEEGNFLGGNFVWAVMCVISFLGIWATFGARDGSLEGHE